MPLCSRSQSSPVLFSAVTGKRAHRKLGRIATVVLTATVFTSQLLAITNGSQAMAMWQDNLDAEQSVAPPATSNQQLSESGSPRQRSREIAIGVVTGSATAMTPDSVTLAGYVQRPDIGDVYYAYGPQSNSLPYKTELIYPTNGRVEVDANIRLLQPDSGVFYQLVVDLANGQELRGDIQRHLTAQWPSSVKWPADDSDDPCSHTGFNATHRISKHIAVVCSDHLSFAPGQKQALTLGCPADFPRNLSSRSYDAIITANIGASYIGVANIGTFAPVHITRRHATSRWRTHWGIKAERYKLGKNRSYEGNAFASGFSHLTLRNFWRSGTAHYWIFCSDDWSIPSQNMPVTVGKVLGKALT